MAKYPVIYKNFQMLFTSSTYKATYDGLVKKMHTTQFVEDLAVLKDCLGQLSILLESRQKRETTIIKASNYTRWTVNALENAKDSLGTKYSFKILISDSPFQRHQLGVLSVKTWLQFFQSWQIFTRFG